MPRQNRDEFLGGGGEVDDEESIIDEEVAIEYGERQTRRDTSIQYRGSSALTPGQIMDQEVFRSVAERALKTGLYLAQLIVNLYVIYNHYYTMIAQ